MDGGGIGDEGALAPGCSVSGSNDANVDGRLIARKTGLPQRDLGAEAGLHVNGLGVMRAGGGETVAGGFSSGLRDA